jgi:hypothetical protein
VKKTSGSGWIRPNLAFNTKRKPVFYYYFIMDSKTRFFQFCFKFQTTPLSMEEVLEKNTRFIAVTGSCSTYENSNATQREETPRLREGKSHSLCQLGGREPEAK